MTGHRASELAGKETMPAIVRDDWVPDHNWGGSGMIGLQEMLLQTTGDTIYLFPCWPKDKDVYFKLHAPHNTTIEVEYVDGVLQKLEVTPQSRRKDVVNKLENI